MPYSIAIGPFQVVPETATRPSPCTCTEATKGCSPSFVFSVKGQVKFRSTLEHLTYCQKRECMSLRKKVRESMYEKLKWLFEEDALLGCVHVQPLLYREKRVTKIDTPQHFLDVANHLAHCPHDSCSRLRRSFLLTVRKNCSPNANAGK